MTPAPCRPLNDSAETQRGPVSATAFASRSMSPTFSMIVIVPVVIASSMPVTYTSTRSSAESRLFGDTGSVRLFGKPKSSLNPCATVAGARQ